ncbi:MAG: GntR family transcriptional regulator [Gammaproteobacteria bacterium]|nr:GntR family transcriptional regulator [Gammaproteobacteria bacterium]
MEPKWINDQPIYLQLRDRVIGMILDSSLAEGEALPSVRNVASQYQVNPMTVMKAYQSLVDDGLVEKRRGRGMFCCEGARARLLDREKMTFISEEWPRILNRIRQLGLKPEDLLKGLGSEEAL